jgi:hypothetical protein
MVKMITASLGVALMLAVPGCKPANSGDSSGSMKMNGDSSMSTASTMPAATTYTCTMHPEVVSDKPGKCPKCGMDLVAKK